MIAVIRRLGLGLELPLVHDPKGMVYWIMAHTPADQSPHQGTDPPVDTLHGLAFVFAAGVFESVPGSAGVAAWGDARVPPSPGHIHSLG